MLQTASLIAGAVGLALIAIGIWKRHHTRVHIPIMISAFVIDLANVLVIELSRGAVQQTIETAQEGGDWIKKFHIAVSVICMVCYLIALITGPLLLKKGKCRRAHRLNAVVFIVTRVANFITSFMVV